MNDLDISSRAKKFNEAAYELAEEEHSRIRLNLTMRKFDEIVDLYEPDVSLVETICLTIEPDKLKDNQIVGLLGLTLPWRGVLSARRSLVDRSIQVLHTRHTFSKVRDLVYGLEEEHESTD